MIRQRKRTKQTNFFSGINIESNKKNVKSFTRDHNNNNNNKKNKTHYFNPWCMTVAVMTASPTTATTTTQWIIRTLFILFCQEEKIMVTSDDDDKTNDCVLSKKIHSWQTKWITGVTIIIIPYNDFVLFLFCFLMMWCDPEFIKIINANSNKLTKGMWKLTHY